MRDAVAVSGVDELPWSRWLVVMDDSASSYGGQYTVLRLWVPFLLWWSTGCTGFGVVPDARLELGTLCTGWLMGLR